MFCKKCGGQFSENAKFCPTCGEPSSKPNLHEDSGKPKKKTGLIIGILVAIIAIIIIVVLIIGKIFGSIIKAVNENGEINFTTANIDEVYMASEVDKVTSKPITKEDNFEEGTKTVYLTVKVKNAPEGTELSAIWYYLPTGESIDSGKYELEKSTQWIYFYLDNPDGLSPGEYEAEIFINREVQETLKFNIQGDNYQAEDVTTPAISPAFTDGAIATQIDEISGEPFNNVKYLTRDDTIVYATVFIENAPVGTEVQAIWTYVPTGEILEGEFLYTNEPSSWVYYYLENAEGLTPGNYEVEFFINGENMLFMDFVVEE